MDKKSKMNIDIPGGIDKLREEHMKVVKDCDGQIQHWKKVEGDYSALEERLQTLPDKLSYDIMVPFGPLAFMPGKMVHTNEITVLLGDNWFAKCSAKQAQGIVGHRKQHVKSAVDDLQKTRKTFEARVSFTQDLGKLSEGKGDYVDIREEVENKEKIIVSKGKQRVAHKPHSKPKREAVVDLGEEGEEEEEDGSGGGGGDGGSRRGVLSEEELWAKLDELEKQEEQQDEEDRSGSAVTNGEDSSSSEEEKEREGGHREKRLGQGEDWKPAPSDSQVNGVTGPAARGGEEDEEGSSLPTIYFSHTVEPKKVRINTGKNTTLKFSERKEQKEQAKRRRKNSGGSNGNGHAHHEHHRITSPTDVYRLFVDVKNGELIPRKSILKSRSRENSVCSDTSESSAADLEERRTLLRSQSHDDVTTPSDTSDGITEEDSPTAGGGTGTCHFEAFSGTVVEKDPLPSSTPHPTLAPPALPTIPERRLEEVAPEAPQEPPKRVSKFKASRLQHK
ncbi:unconventional prefoldin RPB5 interactor 1 isoform X2 [Hypomesus transpacificus]|uniref:unconventional prefoldin RPB5 interactor 1 isoform X2 n=1 Tax=Hypomesus transpacificus TaxID=137520 RepID=UPI001F081A25|nr:unconventional prefoldin RPB5 interactor 1 isoform X2 [Hypomesus transpacificus]